MHKATDEPAPPAGCENIENESPQHHGPPPPACSEHSTPRAARSQAHVPGKQRINGELASNHVDNVQEGPDTGDRREYKALKRRIKNVKAERCALGSDPAAEAQRAKLTKVVRKLSKRYVNYHKKWRTEKFQQQQAQQEPNGVPLTEAAAHSTEQMGRNVAATSLNDSGETLKDVVDDSKQNDSLTKVEVQVAPETRDQVEFVGENVNGVAAPEKNEQNDVVTEVAHSGDALNVEEHEAGAPSAEAQADAATAHGVCEDASKDDSKSLTTVTNTSNADGDDEQRPEPLQRTPVKTLYQEAMNVPGAVAAEPSTGDRREYRQLKRKLKLAKNLRGNLGDNTPDQKLRERLTRKVRKLSRKYRKYHEKWDKESQHQAIDAVADMKPAQDLNAEHDMKAVLDMNAAQSVNVEQDMNAEHEMNAEQDMHAEREADTAAQKVDVTEGVEPAVPPEPTKEAESTKTEHKPTCDGDIASPTAHRNIDLQPSTPVHAPKGGGRRASFLELELQLDSTPSPEPANSLKLTAAGWNNLASSDEEGDFGTLGTTRNPEYSRIMHVVLTLAASLLGSRVLNSYVYELPPTPKNVQAIPTSTPVGTVDEWEAECLQKVQEIQRKRKSDIYTPAEKALKQKRLISSLILKSFEERVSRSARRELLRDRSPLSNFCSKLACRLDLRKEASVHREDIQPQVFLQRPNPNLHSEDTPLAA